LQSFQCACLHTSYYIASITGRLNKILQDVPVSTELRHEIRKLAVAITAWVFCFSILDTILTTYYILSTDYLNFAVAPFFTLILVGKNGLIVCKLVMLVFERLSSTIWVQTETMNQLLAFILVRAYRQLYQQFRQKTRIRKGVISAGTISLTMVRHRHQNLCEAVFTADRFMMLSNLATVFCHAVIVILLLYSLVFFGIPISNATAYFWLIFVANAGNLANTIFSGVMINHSVRLYETGKTFKLNF
jgi:hypothetical protein